VQRNIGGRITPAIIRDIAYASYLVDTKAPEGPYFEVAIIHHTDCGSTLLADDELPHGFAQRVGADERTLADTPVLDPARTVQTDVNRVLWAAEVPKNVSVSGHVYDVDTGLVTTIVEAKARKEQEVRSRFSAARGARRLTWPTRAETFAVRDRALCCRGRSSPW
jgi:carbonic anhydrase